MPNHETKVIGYFAYSSPQMIVCSGRACVISGSETAMRQYIKEKLPKESGGYTIRKTRFGEIMQGLSLGAAYAFDEESYNRFLPLGREERLKLKDANFSKHRKAFFTVKIK